MIVSSLCGKKSAVPQNVAYSGYVPAALMIQYFDITDHKFSLRLDIKPQGVQKRRKILLVYLHCLYHNILRLKMISFVRER